MTAGVQQETKAVRLAVPYNNLSQNRTTNSPVDYWPSGGRLFNQITPSLASCDACDQGAAKWNAMKGLIKTFRSK